MSENTKPNNERPADLAVQDSVGGMARRLLNPAHLRDLAGRSVKTLREQGAEQLWRDVKFRVGLAMHHDDWRHRADIPLRRELKAQRAAHLQGPKISIIVPLYNTPAKLFDEMLQSVVRQTYTNWELVLVDASDADKRLERRLPKAVPGTIVYEPIENGGIALNTTRGFALAHGEYITLLDHDDVLYPNALFEVVQTIQNTGADFVYSDEIVLSADLKELGGYHFKPDFAPDYLRGANFITHLAVFSRPLLDAAGAYESKEFDGAQDHDLILRLTEKARRIEHIKKVLYIWRAAAGSTAAGMEAKPYAVAAGERAIDAQLKRLGLPGHAMAVPDAPGAFQVRYELTGHPKISVLIPSKDHIDDLDRCLTSLYKNAGYDNFEVIVIENNSTDPATFAYYETLPSRFADCRVVYYKGAFNFSAINNFGATFAEGEHLLLLNNDVEVVNGDWLTELLRQCAHPGGAAICGAMLWYPDETIQHAGIVTGLGGYAGHSHKYKKKGGSGYLFRTSTVQDFSGVTGACLLVKTSVWDEVGGLDEGLCGGLQRCGFLCPCAGGGLHQCVYPLCPALPLREQEPRHRGQPRKAEALPGRGAPLPGPLGRPAGRGRSLHQPQL